MSRYQVLVDSSIWISYFKNGEPAVLDRLIQEDLVCTNEIILSELIPLLLKQKEHSTVEGLLSLERIPLHIDWEIIRRYQLSNLQNGINHVGIPDVIILQQVIDQKLSLFSFDKHFELMGKDLSFDLFDQ